jgi:hypothetical protein
MAGTVRTTRVPTAKNQIVIPLYDLDQVARFIHAVAYIQVTASSTKFVPRSWAFGTDEIQAGDPKAIRDQADQLSSNLMNKFSMLCKTGSKTTVGAFLEHLRAQYKTNWAWINSQYAQFNQANQQHLRDLQIASDIAHIVHGTADATFTVLSLVVTGGGAGLLTAKGLNIADSVISGYGVGGVKGAGEKTLEEGGKEVAGHVAEKVTDKYWDKAGKTLTNVVSRDWKYQGALRNAEVRLVNQTGVAVAASGAKVFLAFLSLRGVVKENVKEVRAGIKDLRELPPAPPAQSAFGSGPDLQVPLPRR